MKKTLIIALAIAIPVYMFFYYMKKEKVSNLNKEIFHNEQIVQNPHISLLNDNKAKFLSSIKWSESHADERFFKHGGTYLGGGMLYYGLVQAIAPQVAVIIGSGAGFVPAMVSQAQKDMDLPNGVTYLVDTHLEVTNIDSGQNYGPAYWRDSNAINDNIYTLNMRSSYAAKLFAKENVKIDYLHIDGDHSLKGIMEDWHYYLPLLNKNAVITFHDIITVKEVKLALDKIKKENPSIEYIVLPNISAGIVIAQLGGTSLKPLQAESSNNLNQYFSENKKVLKTEDFMPQAFKVNFNSPEADSRKIFDYLQKPEFLKRYQIAAQFLDADDKAIIELGGFPNSILNFVSRSKNIQLIEKYATTDWLNNLFSKSFEKKVDLTVYPELSDVNSTTLPPYNLAILGLDIQDGEGIFSKTSAADIKSLFALIKNANKIFLEFSNYPLSVNEFSLLKEIFQFNVQKHEVINNNPDGQNDPRFIRNIYLIDGVTANKNFDSDKKIQAFLHLVSNE